MIENPVPQCEKESLTPRQTEIINLLALGLSYSEVGAKLGITEASVKSHVTRILRGLGKKSAPQAVFALARNGSIDIDAAISGFDLNRVGLLTKTQLMVLKILTLPQTGSNRDIADELGRSVKVVKNHLNEVYDILSVSGRTTAGLFYIAAERMGIITSQTTTPSSKTGIESLN